VNRADFIPDVIWVRREDGWLVPLDRAKDPETWLKMVNEDDSIVTQADDGELQDGKGIIPTSSSSAPSVMQEMIDLLDVRTGMNILEIGAGTGYNAALLAQQAHPGHITTIEVDPEIADHARQALSKTGYRVSVVTGDGTVGYPERAPYDRIMAAAGAVDIPYAWIEQTRPSGRILVPMVVGFFECQAFLSLTVHGDGTAHGRFYGQAGFMRLRNQRDQRFLWRLWNQEGAHPATTTQFPREPFDEYEAGFAIGVRLPGWVTGKREEDDGTTILMMSHFDSGSWATVTSSPNGKHRVAYDGPRRLWEELEAAYRWWVNAGRPDHTRFGLTATPDGQRFWLDSPDQVISPTPEQ
jgi:protein-L-isoaspartate(D-aspartate) O-methyltransferase